MALTITVLVDNCTSASGLKSEHGLAMWIEYNGQKILFDTGQSNAVLSNAEALAIDLSLADAIVLSHGHYDHTGGLAEVLNHAVNAKIYMHPRAAKQRYAIETDKPTRYIGMPQSAIEAIEKNKHRVIYKDSHDELLPGVWVTGEIARQTGYEQGSKTHFNDKQGCLLDRYEDDLALVCKVQDGVVVILGCAHSGVVNTINCIQSFYPAQDFEDNKIPIKGIIGGFHLQAADQAVIELTLNDLKNHQLHCISPMHCTGDRATDQIKSAFPLVYREAYIGQQYKFE